MTTKRLSTIAAGSLAIAAVIAPAPAGASTGSAHAAAAAITDYPITVLSDSSDGGAYIWDAQLDKDPTDPTYSDISVLSGTTRFKWTWPGGGTQASHNVKMKVGVNFFTKKPFSTPGLDFFGGKGSGSPFTNDSGVDVTWPTKENGGVDGWVPTKAGTYYLFCSQHSGMFMRVIVKPLVTAASTKRMVKSGTRKVSTTIIAAADSASTVRIVLCRNGSCSKSKTLAKKAYFLRKGSNSLTIPTSGLAAGNYKVTVSSNGNEVAARFKVKGSSTHFTG